VNFELECGSFNFTAAPASISGGIDVYYPTAYRGDVDFENSQKLIPRGAVPPPGVTLMSLKDNSIAELGIS